MTISKHGSYVVISPVKDEERFIESTIQSVCSQTIKPARWIIVDDGSQDRTPEIILRASRQHNWIVNLRISRDKKRNLGSAEIRAFEEGYKTIQDERYDFVVKLDGDLEVPGDYFERLLDKFGSDHTLGIASGVYLECKDGAWKTILMPAYHAAGAAKMVRTECFQSIGGFPLYPGWDTADEIKAWGKGWKTRHFPEIQFHHLKPEGSMHGAGTHILHGEVYYACGGGYLFLIFKTLDRMIRSKPILVGGILLFYGYMRTAIRGGQKLVTAEEARLYRNLLNARIKGSIAKLFPTLNTARAEERA